MTEKFLSFRIEKLSSISAAQNQFYHDYRIVAPKYADPSLKAKNKRINRSQFFNEMRQSKEPNIIKKYNESQKTRIKEKTGRTAQASAEFFNSGILTFSPQMKDDYENNPEMFSDSLKNFTQELEDLFGLQAIYMVIHLDENCPHAHFLFDNIGQDGKSIRRKINPIILSNIQTAAGKHFSKMGYQRGKSVEETSRKHLTVRESHRVGNIIKQLEKEAQTLQIDIKNAQTQYSLFQNLTDELKNKTPEIKLLLSWIDGSVKYEDLSDKAKSNIDTYIKKLSTNRNP